MIVSDLVADLLADDSPPEIKGAGKNRPKSPTNRPAKILAALCESPQSPESPEVDGKRESGDPWAELYHAWLSGIDEARALLTLDAAQVRQAVAQGVVSRETARGSVLLLYRSPPGDLGLGAVGLLAVPREKYQSFSPAAAVQALGAIH